MPRPRAATVLVVDDLESFRVMLRRQLVSLGHIVLEAADGAEGLEVVRSRRGELDLVLTDVVMPGMNGRELARRAEEIRPGIRVLYMTGYSRNAVVHHGRLDEGVELLQKPITQSELAARVRDMLDKTDRRDRTH
jgi:CheY-like chemotaxis protein